MLLDDLDFGSIGIVKNLCCECVWTYSWCIWEILLACVNLFHGHVKSFVDMNINKLVDMEEFLWAWNFGYVMLDHGKLCGYDLDMWDFFFN